MLFGQDRAELRRAFCTAWRKRARPQTLQPLERIIVTVIAQHPEYHALLEAPEDVLQRDFLPENEATNPFLHMGMHIAIHEQLQADWPAGIANLYRLITQRHGDTHQAEHVMMECLGEALWQAQRENRPPDERAYLSCLQRMADGR